MFKYYTSILYVALFGSLFMYCMLRTSSIISNSRLTVDMMSYLVLYVQFGTAAVSDSGYILGRDGLSTEFRY